MGASSDWQEGLAVERHGATVLTSLTQMRRNGLRLAAAHAAESAWKDMELDGVVALGDAPVAYVRRVRGYDELLESDLHRRHWLNSTAPLLFVVDDTSFRAYSSRPRSPGKETGMEACVQVLDRVANALEIQHLLEHVRTGSYFRDHQDHFQRKNSVDHLLLSELRRARNAIWNVDRTVSLSDCHTLLVRALFLRFAADRGLLDESFFGPILGTSSTDLHGYLGGNSRDRRRALGAVWSELAHRLGIREFEDSRRFFEEGPFLDEHFDVLSRFLRDEDVSVGQLTLGTWRYDLSLLPVELISAIYQEFIYDEVPSAKRDLGLVPTPRFLAEVVLNLSFETTPGDKPRILDPACGSGIFLVGCFNRLAFDWRARHPNSSGKRTFETLKQLLSDAIVGVELKDTACELARLNLLHALLSQVAVDQLRGIMLTHQPQSEALLPATNVIAGDFFSQSVGSQLREHSFDLVIGNPPWSKGGVPGWSDRFPERPIPERGNLVFAFCWSVADYLKPGASACLLLDAKAMLFSPPARHFSKAWFRAMDVSLIVNLAAFRNVLFKGAGRAAAIFRFSESNGPLSATRYVTPWPSGGATLGGVLDLSDAKSENIHHSQLVAWSAREELPSLFRPRLFGTARDLAVLERLRRLDTLGSAGWEVHQGFNRHGTTREAEARPLVDAVPFLPTALTGSADVAWGGWLPIDVLTRPYGQGEGEVNAIRQWPSVDRVFRGPRVVMHQTPLQSPPMFRAAFADEDFTFHKEIRGIYGEDKSTDDYRLLAGLLMSEFAYYYFFHTSLSWGVESMPQVRQEDVRSFPWVSNPNDEQKIIGRALIDEIAALEHIQSDYRGAVESARRKVSELALDYYVFSDWEKDLVRDCIATASSLAFSGGAVPLAPRMAAQHECATYISRLTSALRSWSTSSKALDLAGTAFFSPGAQVGVVILQRGGDWASEKQAVALESDDELTRVLGQLKEIAVRRYGWNGSPTNLMVFEGDSLYITKPLGVRHWTRTAALNDADAIVATLLRGGQDAGLQ